VKDVDKEDASVFVEGAAYPDSQRDAEGQVDQVSAKSDGHDQPPLS